MIQTLTGEIFRQHEFVTAKMSLDFTFQRCYVLRTAVLVSFGSLHLLPIPKASTTAMVQYTSSGSLK